MTAIDALQSCLAAEHAAIYGYGVLGGILAGTQSASDLERAEAAYAAHVQRRDDLRERLHALGADPVVAEPAYRVDRRVHDVASCRAMARELETRTAAVYAGAVAQTVDTLRAVTARALTDCALRANAWGARDDVLPGLDER